MQRARWLGECPAHNHRRLPCRSVFTANLLEAHGREAANPETPQSGGGGGLRQRRTSDLCCGAYAENLATAGANAAAGLVSGVDEGKQGSGGLRAGAAQPIRRAQEMDDQMKANTKLFNAVARSENLAELRHQRAAATKDPENADFVAAIDARVAEIGAAWEADPMSNAYKNLLDDIKRANGPPLARTRPMVKKRTNAGMSIRAAVIDAVTTLVRSDEAPTGFKQLFDMGRLDLTFEAFVLKFSKEFPPIVAAAARKRLDAAGYHPA